jgi:hypothetical protein
MGISEIIFAEATCGNSKKTIDLESLDYDTKEVNKNKLSYKMGLV